MVPYIQHHRKFLYLFSLSVCNAVAFHDHRLSKVFGKRHQIFSVGIELQNTRRIRQRTRPADNFWPRKTVKILKVFYANFQCFNNSKYFINVFDISPIFFGLPKIRVCYSELRSPTLALHHLVKKVQLW